MKKVPCCVFALSLVGSCNTQQPSGGGSSPAIPAGIYSGEVTQVFTLLQFGEEQTFTLSSIMTKTIDSAGLPLLKSGEPYAPGLGDTVLVGDFFFQQTIDSIQQIEHRLVVRGTLAAEVPDVSSSFFTNTSFEELYELDEAGNLQILHISSAFFINQDTEVGASGGLLRQETTGVLSK